MIHFLVWCVVLYLCTPSEATYRELITNLIHSVLDWLIKAKEFIYNQLIK